MSMILVIVVLSFIEVLYLIIIPNNIHNNIPHSSLFVTIIAKST